MNHEQTTTTTSAERERKETYNSSGDILMGMIRQTLGEPIQATVEHNEQIKQMFQDTKERDPDDNDKENNEHI